MHLDHEEKAELKRLSTSLALREDTRRIRKRSREAFLIDGQVDVDRFIAFLTAYNRFIGHARPPFRKIRDGDMKL